MRAESPDLAAAKRLLDAEQGVLFSGLHQRGEVVGRGPDLVYVRFRGKSQMVGVRPRLVRVLDVAPERR